MGFEQRGGRPRRSAGWLALIVIFVATAAAPCAFHGYEPRPTLVERLIQADSVVLARPAKSAPFSFSITKQLRGETTVGALPFLVDSTTRRMLRLKPQAAVLFARDAETEAWHRLVTVDAVFEPLLLHIWTALPEWQSHPDARETYFADLLHHSDKRVRALALRELDLADYATLQALDLEIDANVLRAQLDVMTEMDLRAIRILLMGFAEPTPELSAFLKARITQGIAHDSDMLGAYVLSLVELNGGSGLHWLTETHLSKANHTYNTYSAMVQALAMHFQNGDVELRSKIAETLSARVLFDPELAYVVSLQFSAISANAGLEVPESDLNVDVAIEALTAIEVSRSLPLKQ